MTFANDAWQQTLGLMVPPGTGAKEPSRAKMGIRSRLPQRMRLLSGYVRSLLLGIASTFVRMLTWQLNRFVCAEPSSDPIANMPVDG